MGDASNAAEILEDEATWPTAAFQVVEDGLQHVGAVLDRVVEAAGPARPAMNHIISVRGKMLRPRLVLLTGAIFAGHAGMSPELAAAGELIHTASLLHDDVIDEGDVRRGVPAARVVHSNAVSVLAGDHCLTNAMDLIRGVDGVTTLAEALETVRRLVDGELLQLELQGELNLSEDHYRRVCDLKTASLFVWCARAGARFADASEADVDALGEFAATLGLAFQMRDDLLDFTGTQGFGKRLWLDLRDGRSTLPVILAVQEKPALHGQLNEAFRAVREGLDAQASLEELASEILDSEAPERVAGEIRRRIAHALEILARFSDSPYATMLERQIRALSVV